MKKKLQKNVKKPKHRLRNLFKWAKNYIWLFVLVLIVQMIIPFTYSYVPQFTKYIFDYVLDNTGAKNTLPRFLLDFFGEFSGIKAAAVVGLVLVGFQLFRALMMFLNRYLKSLFSENVARDMRVKMFKHVQDLKVSRHNNLDTGDMIQRCTSDNETIRQFLSNQLPELFYIFTTMIAGSIQMASVNKGITFVTLIIVPISFVTSIIFFRFITKQFDKVEKVEADMTSVFKKTSMV